MDDLTGPTPKITDLIAHGMQDYYLRALSFDPPPGNRGREAGSRAVEWCCTIVGDKAARPTIRAIRADPDAAERDARLRFMAIFAKGRKIDPVSVEQKPREKASPKSPVKKELDDEASSLI